MELRLQKLIEQVIGIADIRNLSATNPITVTQKNLNSNDNTILIVAVNEPWQYPLPANVTWINYNTESVHYKRALKRTGYDPQPANGYTNSWELLETYDSVFNPPQYWEEGSSDLEDRFNHHIDTVNNPNPHEIAPGAIGALALSGGVMTGPIIVRTLPPATNYGQQELIPRQYVDQLVSALEQQIADLENQLGSGMRSFKHEQAVASNNWEIEHDLNAEDIIIQVFDTNGHLMLPDQAYADGPNNAIVSFYENLAGTALIIPIVPAP